MRVVTTEEARPKIPGTQTASVLRGAFCAPLAPEPWERKPNPETRVRGRRGRGYTLSRQLCSHGKTGDPEPDATTATN